MRAGTPLGLSTSVSSMSCDVLRRPMRLILTLFIMLCARVTARASLPSQSPLRLPTSAAHLAAFDVLRTSRAGCVSPEYEFGSVFCGGDASSFHARERLFGALQSSFARSSSSRVMWRASCLRPFDPSRRRCVLGRRSVSTSVSSMSCDVLRRPMRLILTLFIMLCARVTARASLPSQSPLRLPTSAAHLAAFDVLRTSRAGCVSPEYEFGSVFCGGDASSFHARERLFGALQSSFARSSSSRVMWRASCLRPFDPSRRRCVLGRRSVSRHLFPRCRVMFCADRCG